MHAELTLSKPRIMVVMDQFWAPTGGTEQNILFLCNKVSAVGVDTAFHVLSYMPEECRDLFSIPVHPAIPNRIVVGMRFLTKVRHLATLLVAERIDIVHAMCPISEFAAVLATRFGASVAIMGSRRNVGYWHTYTTKWRARVVSRYVRHFISNCAAARDAAVNTEGIAASKFTIIPNPINLERFQSASRGAYSKDLLDIGSASRVVAIVANLRPVKDHETLFRAAQILLTHDPKVKFLVIGEGYGAYQESLKKLASDLGIQDSLRWIGDSINPFQILSLVDIGVLCSRSEGYSNALVEYAVAGIPTIASRVGGTPEIVFEGVTGMLFEPGNYVELANKLLLLLSDVNLQRTLGQQAQQRVLQNNSHQQIVSSYKHAYERISRK